MSEVFVSQKNGLEFVPSVSPADAVAVYRHLQDAESGMLIKRKSDIKAMAMGATIRNGMVVKDDEPKKEPAKQGSEEMSYEAALEIVKQSMKDKLEDEAKAARAAVSGKPKQA